MTAPKAVKHPIIRTFHGRDFHDDYEWLRDKDNPEVIEYLEAENAYTEKKTSAWSGLADDIYAEIKSRIKETDMSIPQRQGNWWYYGRTVEGKNYGISCRVPTADDPWTPPEVSEDMPDEQVLLDVNELADGHEFFSLGASSVSTSGRLLAYSFDTEGSERFTMRIKNLETGELLDDQLDGVFYGATWAGEDYLFYVRCDDAWRPHQIWRHKVGTAADEDVLVYEETDEKFGVGVGADRAERFLMIVASSSLTSEYRVLDLDNPTGEFEVLWPRDAGIEYHPDYCVVDGTEYWVITHNAHGANFCVATTPVGELAPLKTLDVLVGHSDTVRIEGIDTYRDFMFMAYRRGGIPRLAVSSLSGGFGEFDELEFSEELYNVGLGGNPEWDAPVVRLGYSSYTQPSQVLDYEVATGKKTLLKQQEVEGGYNADDYEAFRIWATADDGAQVPVSVVRRKGVAGPAPLLLYGYGSYEASMDPGFSVARLSLLDRGMIWACAHVRGGGEMGRAWYDNGKMLHKVNTFTDFIASADAVVAEGLTTHDKMVAEGGSAGGLLMGAVANMAPGKFAGIQAIVPFVDPLTSILKPELPLTVGEWEEWGDPYHDSEVYDYMATYAPYENVAAQDYPDILAVTSLNDTRVLYVEPAKWVAKLREVATGGEILLKTEMSAGHGGVSGRYAKWKQTAFEYAWTLVKSGAVEAPVR
ncbi:S9 family peptidase [Corynebacterium lujinxingii]|uniref:S9 family peptidase n=1 Tax=Corynebacterium lujinxingii TaxID=2763010 RepID=A0A7H0JY03_9CORY|nr:S9 family peptidase [Corynebacterium lujinxingii]MBC3178388.1 S9 family peptidase [Corynebacterium lujinxingii]NNO10734.1 prolyl oligopeptidase family serine peptidase [Corynebacterium lujinxingii]QNP89919.1 S9 family peptidase [Corynebacterium lujinxingii]